MVLVARFTFHHQASMGGATFAAGRLSAEVRGFRGRSRITCSRLRRYVQCLSVCGIESQLSLYLANTERLTESSSSGPISGVPSVGAPLHWQQAA